MRAMPEAARDSDGVRTRLESVVSTGKGKAPTGGPHLSVAGRKGRGGRPGWAGEREWAGAWRCFGPWERKEKNEKGKEKGREGLGRLG